MAVHLNKLKSSPWKDAFSKVWLKLVQWFWRRRWKCAKLTTPTTTTTMTCFDQNSLQLRWAKKKCSTLFITKWERERERERQRERENHCFTQNKLYHSEKNKYQAMKSIKSSGEIILFQNWGQTFCRGQSLGQPIFGARSKLWLKPNTI